MKLFFWGGGGVGSYSLKSLDLNNLVYFKMPLNEVLMTMIFYVSLLSFRGLHLFYKKQTFCLQPGCFLIFCQIQP